MVNFNFETKHLKFQTAKFQSFLRRLMATGKGTTMATLRVYAAVRLSVCGIGGRLQMANKMLLKWKMTGNLRYCVRTFKSSSQFSLNQRHFDIAIAGGGMVGTAMACAIARNTKLSGKKVLLLEGAPHKEKQKKLASDPYSNRVVSLNPGTKKFFEDLDIWKHIENVRYHTVKKLQVWDSCSDAMITFNNDQEDDVSYIVENDVVMFALDEGLRSAKNITTEYSSKVKEIQSIADNKKLKKLVMDGGLEITCDLLVREKEI